MSKITIFLFIIFLVAIILFLDLKKSYQNNSTMRSIPQISSVPTPNSESILLLSPNALTAVYGKKTSVDVIINNTKDSPTLIQIEIAYDPNVLTKVQVIPGSFFSDPVVLLNSVNQNTGRISYAIKTSTDEDLSKRNGVVATIVFTPGPGLYKKQTELYFLPKTTIKKYQTMYNIKGLYGTKITFSTKTTTFPVISITPSIMINK